MENMDKQFHPEDVDAQIDDFLQIDDQAKIADQPDIRLVQEMSDLYLEESQVLDRAWKRISERVQNTSSETPISIQRHQIKKGNNQLKNQAAPGQKKNIVMKRLSAIGLGLVAAVILASVVLVLNSHQTTHTTHDTNSTTAAANTSSTANPASGPGHVVLSTPLTGYNTVELSPDGKRVADFQEKTKVINETTTTNSGTTITPKTVSDGEILHLWDAMSGQHPSTIDLKLNDSETISTNAVWSPTSEFLAIPTSERVIILNAQTGKIITNYRASTMALISPSTPSTALTSFEIPATKNNTQTHLLPLTSASSFTGVAWSADGKSIASAYFPGAQNMGGSASIRIWDPATGKGSAMLTTDPGWGISDISWSSDGKDITASMSSAASPNNQVEVWNVQTQQMIFQQSNSHQIIGSSWQPGTHNLAFSVLSSGSFDSAVLQLWNVDTKQQIKSIAGITANSMAWSPNGKEIAYNTPIGGDTTSSVIIVDVNSGQKLYTYKVSTKAPQSVNISVAGWTPDGQYIVTSEATRTSDGNTTSTVLKVWVA